MEKQILNLNKLRAKNGEITVVQRTDEKKKIHYSKAVVISGTISAPGNFIQKRKDQDKKERCNVQYSYLERYITLTTNEKFAELGYEIEGKLTKNPIIDQLAINTNKIFSIAELTKHLRFNSLYFSSKEQHGKIIQELQRFKAKVESEITKINDQKGNIEDTYKVTLNSNAELNFKLTLPVFIGQPNKTFLVEIACEARNRAVEFWLESTELVELLNSDTVDIINKELERFPEEFVFIEQ